MKCTYLRSCLLGNFSFFLGFLPNLHGLLRFAFSQVLEAKSRISFCKEKGNSFLPSVEQATHWGATSLVTPLFFAYSLFVERNSWTTLECCCTNLCGHHSQLSPAPLSVLASVRSDLGCLLFVGIAFIHSSLTLFNSPLTISANWFAFLAMPLQCDMVRGVLDGFV